jgi:hypothetical protein
MKWFVIKITSLLLIGIALTDIHMVVLFLYPNTAELTYSLWLDKNYNEEITVLWYIYEISNILKNIIWCYAFAKVAHLISYKLFKILLIFFFYHITQFAFYVWDRNTVFFSNIIVYIYMTLAILFFFMPHKKGGKLINIEDY